MSFLRLLISALLSLKLLLCILLALTAWACWFVAMRRDLRHMIRDYRQRCFLCNDRRLPYPPFGARRPRFYRGVCQPCLARWNDWCEREGAVVTFRKAAR